MKELIERHHRDFIDLLDSIRTTDGAGNKVGVYRGIEAVCGILKERAAGGGKVLFIGNGGSAAIASHMAVDFWRNGGIEALAFNDGALLTCIGNDFGYERVFEKPVEMFAKEKDVLFAISSSGKSENILRGAAAAKSKGCAVVTLSGFDADNPLSSAGKYNFYVPSRKYGPVEVVHQYICHWILDTLIDAGKGK